MSDELSIEEILAMPEMKDVVDELEDPRYGGRSHGSRATYAIKCRGPLCNKVERDRQRRRNQAKARKAGRPYQASIHRVYDRDDLLAAITAWHKREMALNRVERGLAS